MGLWRAIGARGPLPLLRLHFWRLVIQGSTNHIRNALEVRDGSVHANSVDDGLAVVYGGENEFCHGHVSANRHPHHVNPVRLQGRIVLLLQFRCFHSNLLA